ncbi:hypothetical protein N7468_004297, partial [Penicillium chermesinum]
KTAMGAPPKDFTVTIVGGGIGGLTLAAGLLSRNVPFQIYEAAAAFAEVGLGVSIGPAAHRAMSLIHPRVREIYDSLITTHADSPGYEAFRQTWFELLWASGAKEGDTMMRLEALPSGQTAVRRASLLEALAGLIPPEMVHFGKRLKSYTETDSHVELRFEDGTTVCADVVIGCDGIKSQIKQSMLPEESAAKPPRYSGMYGYRAVLNMDDMVSAVGDRRARLATLYLGHGAYGISYPIAHAQKVNVGLFVLHEKWDDEAWIRPAKREDLMRDASSMGRYMKALAEYMPDPSQWALFEHPGLSTFYKSRVAIMGDAAHATTPHQGAGAGQAIEDAHVLCELLGDSRVTSPSHVMAAFKAYDEIRRPRTQKVVASSKENGDLLCLCLDGVGDDEELIKQTIEQRMRGLWDIDIQGQAEQARKKMVEYLS